MNKLFLLIPAIDEDDIGQDMAYLKLLGNVNADTVINILRPIVKGMKYVEEEDVKIVYDHKYLGRLFRWAKESQKKKESQGDMPQIENLFQFFNDAVSIQELKIGNVPVKVNGVAVESGIVNALIENNVPHHSLLNRDALNDQGKPIEVETERGEHLHLRPLTCDPAEVYLWLVENRFPRRVLDGNYKKHTGNEKYGKRGVKISPVTYTKEQLDIFLQKAVVAKRGAKELYFKDNERDKIIIFFDENLDSPSYHAFEIATDDMLEIQKMYKRGGRELINRINNTSRISR